MMKRLQDFSAAGRVAKPRFVKALIWMVEKRVFLAKTKILKKHLKQPRQTQL